MQPLISGFRTAFMEDLNNTLNRGNITNQYNKEDISQLVEGMKEAYKANEKFKEIQDDTKKSQCVGLEMGGYILWLSL